MPPEHGEAVCQDVQKGGLHEAEPRFVEPYDHVVEHGEAPPVFREVGMPSGGAVPGHVDSYRAEQRRLKHGWRFQFNLDGRFSILQVTLLGCPFIHFERVKTLKLRDSRGYKKTRGGRAVSFPIALLQR